MQPRKEIVAAISAAVALYIQAQAEEAMAMAELRRRPSIPYAIPGPWVIAGRQSAMEMRRCLQMRLFS